MTSDRYTTVAPRNVTGFNLSAEAKKSKGPISFVLDTVYRYSIGSRIYTLRYSLVLCVGSYSRMPVLKNVRKAKENKFKVGCRSNNSFLAGNVPIFLLLLFCFLFFFVFFCGVSAKNSGENQTAETWAARQSDYVHSWEVTTKYRVITRFLFHHYSQEPNEDFGRQHNRRLSLSRPILTADWWWERRKLYRNIRRSSI